MVNRRALLKTRFIVFMMVLIFVYPACTPKKVPFVVVREKDFRVGPVGLPLEEPGKNEILTFLVKGGDNSVRDYVDPGAVKAYADLFKLLSDPTFLYTSKFRKEGDIGKISKTLEQWFEESIVYSLIDATRDRPPAIAPISLEDKNGKYWWVFYLPEEGEGGEDPKVVQVLVTVAPTKHLQQYGKIR